MSRSGFVLTGEQRAFGAALHDLLADADVPGAARAWAAGEHAAGVAIWRKLAASGVAALVVPQACGGLGADAVDLIVACEELGHHPLPGPLAESIAAVPALLTALLPDSGPVSGADSDPVSSADSEPVSGADSDPVSDRAADWLARLASGDLIATLAMPPDLPFALDADVAGLVLLTAGAAPDTISLGEPAARHRSADPARALFDVRPGQALATGAPACAAVRRAAAHGTLASAGLLLGAGRGLLEASVAHAKTREQFGRPIGSFQAVKHALADVLIALEFARPLVYAAAITLCQQTPAEVPAAGRDISAARVAAADAARLAARTALQVHGAIGYTLECDISLWLAKVRALSATWGSQAAHRAVVLAALGQEGTGPWD
jgi:hypothetical protein